MRRVKLLNGMVVLLTVVSAGLAGEAGFRGRLLPGSYTPGFRLVETSDTSRAFPTDLGKNDSARPMRIYVWYPAAATDGARMRLEDYVRMALDDFHTSLLPVPLAKGLDPAAFRKLRDGSVESVRDAAAGPGRFPVLVFGQGLFYESPISHFVLCEYLASHGYIVATSPLLGTRCRLVNLNVEDIETEARDMEAVAAEARNLPFADPVRLGVIGYDLGGMAGLVFAMRDPRVGAFLSLDSGILDKHHSGLPAAHPQYREDRFRIPWMHMTQARFIRAAGDRRISPSLFERKAFGSSFLVHVPTDNHGQFSSYAALGITAAVPGFWGPAQTDPKPVYEEICRLALAFLDSALKNEDGDLKGMLGLTNTGPSPGTSASQAGRPAFEVESKEGPHGPPSEADLVHLIIERGIGQARAEIGRLLAEDPDLALIDESVLNWLGLHFLYWWGRTEEAVGVFELNTFLYPGSWRAHDSLAEAYADRGMKDGAIRSYRKSLELNPENANAKAALERLSPPVTKRAGRRT